MELVGTVCARFSVPPSDYMKKHDWLDLMLDYEMASVLNDIDQRKKELEYQALTGG